MTRETIYATGDYTNGIFSRFDDRREALKELKSAIEEGVGASSGDFPPESWLEEKGYGGVCSGSDEAMEEWEDLSAEEKTEALTTDAENFFFVQEIEITTETDEDGDEIVTEEPGKEEHYSLSRL